MNKLFISFVVCPPFLSAGLLLNNPSISDTNTTQSNFDVKLFNPRSIQESKNMWLEGEVLLWQASEDGLDYAVKSYAQDYPKNGTVESPHFEGDWGARLALGIKLPHDRWDLLFKYTYLQAQAHSSKSAPEGGALFPLFESPFDLPDNFYADRASFRWKANLNIGDVELGRNCFAGKWVSIRPFMGVRGVVIDQDAHAQYEGGTAVPSGDKDQAHLVNDYWGVGLRMGLNTLWGLGKGWGIYGNGGGSLLSGNFNVHETEKFKETDQKRLDLKADNNNVVAIAELALGIQWDHLFSKDRYHFGVKFGWEFNVFFDQNRLMRFVAPSPGAVSQNDGDLSFQGLTFGFRFDF